VMDSLSLQDDADVRERVGVSTDARALREPECVQQR